MRRSTWLDRTLAGAALWAVCACVCANPAAAQAVIAADGAYALPIKSEFAAPSGTYGLRVGRRIDLPGLWETFELGLNYGQFQPSNSNASQQFIRTYRGLMGVRLGLMGVLRPGLFAHLGVAHLDGDIRASGALTEGSISHTAFTWDGGAYLDFAVASFFEFGLHASYNRIVRGSGPRPFQWADFGGHLQFVL